MAACVVSTQLKWYEVNSHEDTYWFLHDQDKITTSLWKVVRGNASSASTLGCYATTCIRICIQLWLLVIIMAKMPLCIVIVLPYTYNRLLYIECSFRFIRSRVHRTSKMENDRMERRRGHLSCKLLITSQHYNECQILSSGLLILHHGVIDVILVCKQNGH